MTLTYSQHKITDKNNCPFSEAEYSKFKFGVNSYAEKFASELFDGFIEKYGKTVLEQEDLVILPSPYLSIPTASNYLCHYFKLRMNKFLYDNGKRSLAESKIYRNQTYTTDYGSLSYDDRVRLISNDTYYIDRNYIDGKFCIFIDDIKITGSHEHIIKKILDEYNVKGQFAFLYYAELQNTDIHPNIENYYNYFYVKDVESLSSVINSATFTFNTRVVKYILKLEQVDFIRLLGKIPGSLLQKLFDLAVSNNYHTIPDYKTNLDYINKNLTDKQLKYGYQFTERTT